MYRVDNSRWTGGVLFFLFFLCVPYLYTFVILGQGGERFSAAKLPKARGFKGISGLKERSGCFLRIEAFLEKFSFLHNVLFSHNVFFGGHEKPIRGASARGEPTALHGRPMTSVIYIARNSRINWPGNSVYMYQALQVQEPIQRVLC